MSAESATLNVPSEYDTIQDGIDAAENGDTVLVADGTYTGTGNKNLDFGGKAITVESENGPESTTIDCEGSGRGFYFDSGETDTSVVDGFTITDAGSSAIYCDGSSPTIINCRMTDGSGSYGGGIHCEDGSDATIENCIITGNTAAYAGGIYCNASDATITNCEISANKAGYFGGGIWAYNSSPVITNCTIVGNQGGYFGGGIYNMGSGSPEAVNCIVWNNVPDEISGSVTVTYSDVEGGYTGDGNINSDPLFVDEGSWNDNGTPTYGPDDYWSGGDLHLTLGSPCVDSASDDAVPAGVTVDLDGKDRFRDGDGDLDDTVDMGAYEFPNVLLVPSEYGTIQAGINAATDEDYVLVADGTYTGSGNRNLDFDGKAITVMSENGPNSTIIDCEGWPYRGFYFQSDEELDSVVDGFTVKDGMGIECDGSSPTISNCVISGNFNSRGGGIYCYDLACPLIAGCTVTDNGSQYSGGGIECTAGSPIIVDCTITKNECTTGYGGGIACGGTTKIANCVITGNVTYTEGSGIACYYGNNVPEIVNCTILGNEADLGGAVASFMSTPRVTNCIIRQNEPSQVNGNVTVTYSDVEGGRSGEGNIDADPAFVEDGYWDDNETPANPNDDFWVDGDYHLLPATPCLDSGSNSAVPEWLVADMDGETRIVDGDGDDVATVDMGVFERPEALLVPSEYSTIQAAINAADENDLVLVADGTYTGEGNRNLDFGGKAITVQSVNGPNSTIIDCGNLPYKGFYFHSGEGSDSVADGFTVEKGAGIYCDGSSPTILNCVIRDNGNTRGGGIGCWNSSNPIILGCTITENWSQYSGGGIHCTYCSPTIANCTITANECDIGYGGGIACGANTEIVNCLITGNVAGSEGAGIACYYNQTTPKIVNCTIIGNRNVITGCAAVACYLSTPAVTNCIVWDNVYAQVSSGLTVTYSNVEGGCTGEGNIDSDPNFVDPGSWDDNGTPSNPDDDVWEDGDYHLLPSSPCMDSGSNEAVPEWVVIDLDGEDRVVDGNGDETATVDMGVYERPEALLVPSDYTKIQDAIDAAVENDLVLVADGVYSGTDNKDLDFGGKAITVRSENGPEAATIDCDGDGSGFYFHTNEDSLSVVDGFTITDADTGGILCNGGSPMIKNCVVTANSSTSSGGGISCSQASPKIISCMITGNSALTGAGIACGYQGSAIIMNCMISGNSATYHGGGISTDYDGSPEITNCTIVGNAAGNTGGGFVGFSNSTPTLTNSIIWDCSAPYGFSIGFVDPGTPSELTILHSDIEGGTEEVVAPGGSDVIWGDGCIDEDPEFIDPGYWNGGTWVEGDYHLTANSAVFSPCIDAGTNDAVPDWLDTDLDGESRICDGDDDDDAIVDMGAYEVPCTLLVPSNYSTIQAGINAAEDGDVVLVADGTYTGTGNRDLDFDGKAITVQSENGPDSTTIDCESSGHGFYFDSGETLESVVSGFTIEDGSGTYGGGIDSYYSSPTIMNCVVTGGYASAGGGGISSWEGSPRIVSCTVTDNFAYHGGGIRLGGEGSPTLANCSVSGNIADWYGGGICTCWDTTPTIINCTITGNSADLMGGAICTLSGSNPTVVNSILWNDRSTDGPEIALYGRYDNPCELSCSHSDVKGGTDDIYVYYGNTLNWGEGNINSDPLFVDPGYWDDNETPEDPDDDFWVEGDYHLSANSPCIDTGDNDAVPEWLITDLDGGSRIVDGDADETATVDMGADEYGSP